MDLSNILYEEEFKGHNTSAAAVSNIYQINNKYLAYIGDITRTVLMYSLVIVPREIPFQIPENKPTRQISEFIIK